jgi:uncharacterized membrane protein YcaP (DUF421 family)
LNGAFNPAAHLLLEIILRTGVIYLLFLIGVRVSGKREVGQPDNPFSRCTIIGAAVR